MDKQPSEIIKDFLELLDESHELYLNSKSQVDGFNKKTYEWTHDLEDCKNKSERNKLATAWQKELKERRKQKNIWQLFRKKGNTKEQEGGEVLKCRSVIIAKVN